MGEQGQGFLVAGADRKGALLVNEQRLAEEAQPEGARRGKGGLAGGASGISWPGLPGNGDPFVLRLFIGGLSRWLCRESGRGGGQGGILSLPRAGSVSSRAARTGGRTDGRKGLRNGRVMNAALSRQKKP